ncbi:site-specific integrase [Pararhodobacter aggregans]|uniref:site-specific integrase n=1 Tax=Pararhodobacter aggregans TaxID=404875 RepID=UPI003A92EA4E
MSEHWARPKVRASPPAWIAIDCTNFAGLSHLDEELTAEAASLVRASVAPASARAFRGDIAQFLAWGGALPSSPAKIASYIADHASVHAVATIQRRVASISKAHEMAGHPNPCRSETVKATLRGLRRVKGTTQRQAKPLLRDDLFLALDVMGDRVRDHRDRVLLLLGFAGGFRRSELVALSVNDLQPVREGLVVTIRRSKTDQEGAGRRIGVPLGRTRHCPVKALESWFATAMIVDGPVFRPITRHGSVGGERLTGDAVSSLVRERVAAAGIDAEGYSGHSLRAGFATSAAQAGVSTLKIRAQTGHATDAMLARYIRDGELFVGNAAGALL